MRRPVATTVVFLVATLLGLVALWRMPIELLPRLASDELTVSFARPGSEPEVVEREILRRLERRVAALRGIAETRGEVRGSNGLLHVRLARGTAADVREMEITAIAAEVARDQPAGSRIDVYRTDPGAASDFAMLLHAVGDLDPDSLHNLVTERIEPRLSSLPGVARTLVAGGAGRETAIVLDLSRSAALRLRADEVVAALAVASEPARIVGTSEQGRLRSLVVLEGEVTEARELPDLPIARRPLRLVRHVAGVEIRRAPEQSLFRIDGRPSVGIVVFQDSEANLVDLGRRLRRELESVDAELRPLGVGVSIGFDGAELLETQLWRLVWLGLVGLVSACLVLFLFLRRWRAVLVVALPLPVSLAIGLCGFHLLGLSLNLLTLFGLAVALGMLVDNSVVVFEAVERRLERGDDPAQAAVAGIRRTMRALVAASATTAVVFLPAAVVEVESALVRSLLYVVGLAVVIPLAASLLVALGLVPVLTAHLAAAAPTVGGRAWRRSGPRLRLARHLFRAAVIAALRRPDRLLLATAAMTLVTLVFAGGAIAVRSFSSQAPRAETIRLEVRLPPGSLETARASFAHLENVLLASPGVARVEAFAQRDGGSLTVKIDTSDAASSEVTVPAILARLREEASRLPGVEVRDARETAADSNGPGLEALVNGGVARVVLSGPEASVLADLAEQVQQRLDLLPDVEESWLVARPGPREIHLLPRQAALREHGLFVDQLFPTLRSIGREGIMLRNTVELPDGRSRPVRVIRGRAEPSIVEELAALPVVTDDATLPLGSVAALTVESPSSPIQHSDERSELAVGYRLTDGAPEAGRARQAVDGRIEGAIGSMRLPEGYAVEHEVPGGGASLGRFALPVLLLLFWILAVTFESVTLPVLVLSTVPLAVIGSAWGLAVSGLPLDPMALIGALALVGLTVNPAILFVDRAQRLVLDAGWSPGAAALAALEERARPMLMTSATTIAGLWPLALHFGREGEIWPPFAVVVIGGLLTCTLLGLFVVPVAFTLLHGLERAIDHFGRWLFAACLALSAAAVVGLTAAGWVSTLRWQVVVGGLLAAASVGFVAAMRRRPGAEPVTGVGPPALEVRALHKVFGRRGSVGRAWERHAPAVWRPRRRLAAGVLRRLLPVRDEVHALRGVSFRIEGGMVGLLGPNGAGKTTLLRQINAILRPTAGRILLGGVGVEAIGDRIGRWLGYLPQENVLPPRMSPREYLAYFAVLYELAPDERAPRVEEMLRQFGLGEWSDSPLGALSGGMRQRLAVARALLHQPPVVVVDEPTVGLDPAERIRLRRILIELSRMRIVLLSTHVVEDVAAACERVLVIAGGRLAFDGPTGQLAEAAAGRVWEIDRAAGEPAFEAEASWRVTSRVPNTDGGVRLRIVHAERPHPAARPVTPTVEEGYLAVVESAGAAG